MKYKFSLKIKDIVEKYNAKCYGCNLCTNHCIFLKKYIKNPKIFFQNLSIENDIDIYLPYYCFSCNTCSQICPNNIDFGVLFTELKKEISKNKKSPHIKHSIIRNHQMLSNSKIFTSIKGNATIGFMPGCSLSSYNPTLVMKIYDLLKIKYNDINLILRCCGNPSYSIGEIKKFNEIYNSLYTSLNKKNINKIITACQTCYKTLKENSPNLDIVSLWEEIKNFELPKLTLEDKFYIFDSCSADENIKKSIREITKKLNLKIENMETTFSKCCGLGGCVHIVNKELYNDNLNNIKSNINSKNVITYCAGCRDSLSNIKNSYHLLELIFLEGNLTPKGPNKTHRSWINRLKLKAL